MNIEYDILVEVYNDLIKFAQAISGCTFYEINKPYRQLPCIPRMTFGIRRCNINVSIVIGIMYDNYDNYQTNDIYIQCPGVDIRSIRPVYKPSNISYITHKRNLTNPQSIDYIKSKIMQWVKWLEDDGTYQPH